MTITSGSTLKVVRTTTETNWCQPSLRTLKYLNYPLKSTASANVVESSFSRSSNRTLNYVYLRKHRLPIPPNGFNYSLTRDTPLMITTPLVDTYCNYGYFYATFNTRTGELPQTAVWPVDSITDQHKSSCAGKAIKTLLSGAKNSKVNLAVATAEAHKTFSMIAETATKLAKCYTYLRHGNLKRAYNELGLSASRKRTRSYKAAHADDPKIAASNEWLALQFGWKPLLSDLYGTAEILAARQVPVTRSRVIGISTITSTSTPKAPLNGGTGWSTDHVVVGSHTAKYVCHFTESNTAPTLTSMGFTNPAAVMWELVPFSFVVDWFLPIGGYLDNLDATTGLNFVSGTYTTFTKHEFTMHCRGVNLPAVSGYYNGAMQANRTTINCSRAVLSSFPSSRLPEFKSPLSVTHAIDAIALLKQAFFR